MGKYASIYNASDPTDPEVLVHGVGRMKYSQLKKHTIERTSKFLDLLKKDNFEMAAWLTYEKNETLIISIRALKDINDEIEKLGMLVKK